MKHFLALLLGLALLLPLPAQVEQRDDFERPISEIDAWFDDALFIGDSVTRQLHSLIIKERNDGRRPLGEARFVTAHSYMLHTSSLNKLSEDYVNLRHNGNEYTVPGLMERLKPRKVFLRLGLNDGIRKDNEKLMRFYGRTIDLVLQADPEIMVVVQTVGPVTERQTSNLLQQPNINAFNEALQALCRDKDVHFLDVSTPLMGPDGLLPVPLSSDTKVHLGPEALEIWMRELRLFAQAHMGYDFQVEESE